MTIESNNSGGIAGNSPAIHCREGGEKCAAKSAPGPVGDDGTVLFPEYSVVRDRTLLEKVVPKTRR